MWKKKRNSLCLFFSWKTHRISSTLDQTISIKTTTSLSIYRWCRQSNSRSGKRNDALLSSFLPFTLCSFHAFSPLRLLDHEHTIMIHWTTTTGEREEKVISGSIYLRREKKKERVTNDKTITIRLESVSWFLVRWWTLASHWWIIIKDETSQMGMVTVTLRREWTVDDWRENFLLFLLKWLL